MYARTLHNLLYYIFMDPGTDAKRKTAGRCCISYRLSSPAGIANEIHTISSKEVHNCSLLPPFDVH